MFIHFNIFNNPSQNKTDLHQIYTKGLAAGGPKKVKAILP